MNLNNLHQVEINQENVDIVIVLLLMTQGLFALKSILDKKKE